MSYREVTKDDVGKMVEVRDSDLHLWGTAKLEHIMPAQLTHRYIALLDDFSPIGWGFYRHARIRTSPLPDGWLPDDWRVLGDDEQTQDGDVIVFTRAIDAEFVLNSSSYYKLSVGGWCGRNKTMNTAKHVSSTCEHHLCVIRPRWRPATKDDVGKHVSSGIDMGQLKIILNEPDDDGYDCIVYFGGWCVSALKDLKVENEGWHVTN
jgi:hypothetical protein